MKRNPALLYGICLTVCLILIPVSSHRTSDSEIPEAALEYSGTPLSPYDDILKTVAREHGWDWRLLAAMVYHESRFHNEAQSQKGAVGLMQINSSRYTEEMLLDPHTNLTVGARYLKKLQGMFSAASPVENLKFALAAFNLGDGRLRQLINTAAQDGADTTHWDSVAAYLPEGHHTVAYVNKVLDTYDNYRRNYPL